MGSTTIVSATQATVSVSVASDATIGSRDVTYTQPAAGGGASATSDDALAIHLPDPTINSLSTSTIKQGDSGASMTLSGSGFRAGGTVAFSGTGLTISNLQVASATSLTFDVAAADDATVGARNLTYKGAATLRAAAARIPAERLLVETDSPFLSPLPKRGERNVPANVRYTAARLAEVRGTPVEALERTLDANAVRIYPRLAAQVPASG